uniref:Uncharacterized protein n=1 Tax=Rhizophora mucronata TaxID=61149 RepID=A0A2P2NT46_RHIMU
MRILNSSSLCYLKLQLGYWSHCLLSDPTVKEN